METAGKEPGILYEPVKIRTWKDEAKFVIPGVIYKEQTGKYILFEQMTSSMNQDALAELYEQEKQKGNPHPTDMPLIWAIATRGYELKSQNQDAEKLRQFLRTGFRQYPNTLTRIAYNSSGKDRIIHNYRTSDEYSIDAEVIGPDGWINEIPDKNVLENLLETSNVEQINQVSQWVNGTNSYLVRLNSKPEEKIERVARFVAGVARFVAGGGRLGLGCFGDPLGKCPAFRVLKID